MSTTESKKYSDLKVIAFALLAVFIGTVLISLLVGCAPMSPTGTANPDAVKAPAASDTIEPPAEEVVAEDDGIYAFDEIASYPNGISISVSSPADYVPTELAAGMVGGHKNVVVNLTLTNNSEEKYEPLVYNTASSGGIEAPRVFDASNNITFAPTTTVLPGQSITWQEAYSVADPANITLEASIGFEYDAAIYTNAQ
jgi:hypothetical protein